MSDLEQARQDGGRRGDRRSGGGVSVRARSRPHGETDADAHEWDVEADTYELAREEARLAVPEEWDLLSVQVDR